MKAPTLRHRAATVCTESNNKPVTPKAQSACSHYWIIDRATGHVSTGTCRLCGARKQFPNYLSDCIAEPNKESYQEWLSKQEWQDMLASTDNNVILDIEIEGGNHYSVREGRPKIAEKRF